jgi:hypothetical protein
MSRTRWTTGSIDFLEERLKFFSGEEEEPTWEEFEHKTREKFQNFQQFIGAHEKRNMEMAHKSDPVTIPGFSHTDSSKDIP